MKLNRIALLCLVAGSLALVNGCKKDSSDTTAPIISIVGANPYFIQKGTTYTDPSATASDDVDGAVTVTATGSVSTSATGTYTITYSTKDNAGNKSTLTRTVYVMDINGPYNPVVDLNPYPVTGSTVTSNYADNLTMSTDGTGRVIVTKFGDYTNGSVYFNLTSPTALTLPSQTVTCGAPSASRTFSGSGTLSSSAPQVVINFTELTNGTTTTSQDSYTKF